MANEVNSVHLMIELLELRLKVWRLRRAILNSSAASR